MTKKKTFTIEQLQQLSAEEIISKMQHNNYSLLETFDAAKLRKEMVPVGKACNSAINYFLGTTGPKNNTEKHIKAARKKLVKVLSKLTPGDYAGMPTDTKNGLVVGFNHPSLGEIARILMMKIDIMGESLMYFPVNLPWYEALAPNYDRIRQIGIVITPTITPSTWKKLNLKEGTELYEAGKRLKRDFRYIYTDLSHDGLREGGVVFVAPSATRQATVFKNEDVYEKKEEIIPTMSMLALKLYNDPDVKCDFLPMAVLPPTNYKRGLNFHKKYTLIPGRIMTADEIRKKYFKTKNPKRLEGFDYEFHKRIAEKLPKSFWY
ncbi:hypothetical protein IJH15_01375 [Candidatus Saccharibacteria bacterium]|nr:hypothetical protein [Candidatus Saccharibacteria bacterium]MBR3253522.1 hypothetical protein [Candidatus Saccharibacteria bacterium]